MSSNSSLTVHRDVLRSVADRLRAGLTSLDAAVTRVQATGPGVSSLRGWPTGDSFIGNVTNAYAGTVAAVQEVADAHQAAAANLSDSAATYDAAESDNMRAVRGVSGS